MMTRRPARASNGDGTPADRIAETLRQGPSTPADRIAETLRLHGPLTAADIAREHGCGVVAVRSQLRTMEAAGFVARSTERRPIGRPVSRYGLTERAESLFPKRYDVFSERLVEAIVREFGEEGLDAIFARWQDELFERLDATLPRAPWARLEALAQLQTENGFMASVRSDEDGVALVERNCPIAAIAARHPQICRHEAALFGRTLKWKTTLHTCQASGDAACVFQIGRATKRPADGSRRPAESTRRPVESTKRPSEKRS